MPPSKKPVPRTPRSPKEDGEVGETLNDVLARHPILSPGMRQCIDSIYEHAEVITPEVAAAVGRLASAALSPRLLAKLTLQMRQEPLPALASAFFLRALPSSTELGSGTHNSWPS